MLNRYRSLPISHSFLTTPEPLAGYNSLTDVAYNQELVDKLFKNPKVLTDIHRLDVRFGQHGERVSYTDSDNIEDYFARLQAEALKQGTILSLEQVKVIAGYLNSAHGVWLQQGITSIPFGALKGLLSAHSVMFGNDSKDDVYYRITLRNNKIHITHVFYAKEVYLPTIDPNAPPINYDNRPLIKKKHEYVITETDGLFNLEYINNKNDVRVDKEFYKNNLLPAIRLSMQNRDEINVPYNKNEVVFEIYSYVPFLTDRKLAKDFFAFITRPIVGSPGYYLSAAEKIDLAEVYISSCYMDYPAKRHKLLRQLYSAELRMLIADERYDLFTRSAAANVLTHVIELPDYLKNDKGAELAEIVQRTTLSIRDPLNDENASRYGELMKKMKKPTWGKKIAAAMLLVTGLTIITASVMMAIATFGGSSVLSAIGISMATTVIAKALTITTGVAGVALATSGAWYGNRHPFKKLFKASFPFWNPPYYSKLVTKDAPTGPIGTLEGLPDSKQEESFSINDAKATPTGTTPTQTSASFYSAATLPKDVECDQYEGVTYDGENPEEEDEQIEGLPNPRRCSA